MAISAVKDALRFVDIALRSGDHKYGFEQWKKNGRDPLVNMMEHVAASHRHLGRHVSGEFRDRDSHIPALAHVAARALMALEMQIAAMPETVCGQRGKHPVSFAICDLPEGHPGNDHFDAASDCWFEL